MKDIREMYYKQKSVEVENLNDYFPLCFSVYKENNKIDFNLEFLDKENEIEKECFDKIKNNKLIKDLILKEQIKYLFVCNYTYNNELMISIVSNKLPNIPIKHFYCKYDNNNQIYFEYKYLETIIDFLYKNF